MIVQRTKTKAKTKVAKKFKKSRNDLAISPDCVV